MGWELLRWFGSAMETGGIAKGLIPETNARGTMIGLQQFTSEGPCRQTFALDRDTKLTYRTKPSRC